MLAHTAYRILSTSPPPPCFTLLLSLPCPPQHQTIYSDQKKYEDNKCQAKFDRKYHHVETKIYANCVGCPLLIYPLYHCANASRNAFLVQSPQSFRISLRQTKYSSPRARCTYTYYSAVFTSFPLSTRLTSCNVGPSYCCSYRRVSIHHQCIYPRLQLRRPVYRRNHR